MFSVKGAGVAYFSQPPKNPLECVDILHQGRPPIATPDQALLIWSPGRTGYGFSRMAARAPGNENSLIMVVPDSIEEWYRLTVLNHNAPFLASMIVFNPEGQKKIHVLPPRHVEAKLAAFRERAASHPDLAPVLVWAEAQLQGEQGEKLKRVTDYWLAAAQVQAITTPVQYVSSVLDADFISKFHPGVRYIILHPTKSIAQPQREGERPLFGHELIQALLTQHGRADLAGWVVASGGFWVDRTVWMGDRIRLRFASVEEDAWKVAAGVIGGATGFNDLVSISGEAGAEAVFRVQYEGWIKNFLANILGKKCVLALAAEMSRDLDLSRLERGYSSIRNELIGEAEALAGRTLQLEGLSGDNRPRKFSPEGMEDMQACTTVNWPALRAEAERFGLHRLHHRVGSKPLDDGEIAAIRNGISIFQGTAPEGLFGTTNMKIVIVYGLAILLANARLVNSYRDVWPIMNKLPEGINSMPFVTARFSPAGLPPVFAEAIELFKPLWNLQ